MTSSFGVWGVGGVSGGQAEAVPVRLAQGTLVKLPVSSAAQMREAYAARARRGIPLASNQVRCSLQRRDPETDGVLDDCRE